MKNSFKKYCPNVFVAQCENKHQKGEIIELTTKYGKDVQCEVHNYLGDTREGLHLYSITRVDGNNSQKIAEAKANKLLGYAENAEKGSENYYLASQEGKEFLSLGEPIKVGHHSERRHRKLIEKNWERMGKSVAESEKAKEYERRAQYWAERANKIDLSMPDSLEYFEEELRKAKEYHQKIKDFPELRAHSMSLQYANKAVKDLEEKVYTAVLLWGDEEEVQKIKQEREEKKKGGSKKQSKKESVDLLLKKYHVFFAFNDSQFEESLNNLKACGILLEGEKVSSIGAGGYLPSKFADEFIKEYKSI